MIQRSASVSSSRLTALACGSGERAGRPVEIGQDEAARIPELVGEVARRRANDASRSFGSRMTSVPTDMPEISE